MVGIIPNPEQAPRLQWIEFQPGLHVGSITVGIADEAHPEIQKQVAVIQKGGRGRWRLNFTNPYARASSSVTNPNSLDAVKERAQKLLNDAHRHHFDRMQRLEDRNAVEE